MISYYLTHPHFLYHHPGPPYPQGPSLRPMPRSGSRAGGWTSIQVVREVGGGFPKKQQFGIRRVSRVSRVSGTPKKKRNQALIHISLSCLGSLFRLRDSPRPVPPFRRGPVDKMEVGIKPRKVSNRMIRGGGGVRERGLSYNKMVERNKHKFYT